LTALAAASTAYLASPEGQKAIHGAADLFDPRPLISAIESALSDLVYRTNPNIKGSTPNYKKPKGKPNKCSYKGPGPNDPFLLFLIAVLNKIPYGQQILNSIPDAVGSFMPDPPSPNNIARIKGVYDFLNWLFSK